MAVANIFDCDIADFVHSGVNHTAVSLWPKTSIFYLCAKVIDLVKYNFPFVCLRQIFPLKIARAQRCQWHLCAVCTQVRFQHKKQCFGSFAKIFDKVVCTAVSLTWTAVSLTPLCNQPRRFSSRIFKNTLTRVSGIYRSCLMNKTRGRKSCVRVPVIVCQFCLCKLCNMFLIEKDLRYQNMAKPLL
jgi:hypothetical protein